jgi:hypothetical protein
MVLSAIVFYLIYLFHPRVYQKFKGRDSWMDASALCSRPSGLIVNEMIIATVIKREMEWRM